MIREQKVCILYQNELQNKERTGYYLKKNKNRTIIKTGVYYIYYIILCVQEDKKIVFLFLRFLTLVDLNEILMKQKLPRQQHKTLGLTFAISNHRVSRATFFTVEKVFKKSCKQFACCSSIGEFCVKPQIKYESKK